MKTSPIIMLCGSAGSGKDTGASLIQSIIPKTGLIAQAEPLKMLGEDLFQFTKQQLYGPSECRNAPDPRFDTREAWAELHHPRGVEARSKWLTYCGLENYYAELRNWMDDLHIRTFCANKSLTPRLMLQLLGTEFGRKIDPAIWARIAWKKSQERLLSGEANLMLITDGRFKNEVLNTKWNGGMTVLIMTPEPTAQVGVQGHASEEELKTIPLYWFDKVILNMKQLGLDYYRVQIEDFCNETLKDQF